MSFADSSAAEVDLVPPDVIIDVYSRLVVGWTVATRESAALAKELIAEAIYAHDMPAGSRTCMPIEAAR